jgi:hypothetical protein
MPCRITSARGYDPTNRRACIYPARFHSYVPTGDTPITPPAQGAAPRYPAIALARPAPFDLNAAVSRLVALADRTKTPPPGNPHVALIPATSN